MEEVVVTVAPDGSVQVAASGFSGMACTTATAGLEARLGAQVERELTGEAYQAQGLDGQQGVGSAW